MPDLAAPSSASSGQLGRPERLLYLCDWLPPDFGAVGQYSVMFARALADEGRDVVLVGLSSRWSSDALQAVGRGRLREIRLHAPAYEKASIVSRFLWTARINTQLIWHIRHFLRESDTVLFTGSPPYLLHWLAPLNIILQKHLIYRITDFHPECLIAARNKFSIWLTLLYKLTIFWRRRVSKFEVLGEDQRERLQDIGIPAELIRLKRDPSPVVISPTTQPLPRPPAYTGKFLLLYSGNWGVAHDHHTFVAAYRMHHTKGSGRLVLWLNAVGAAVKNIENELIESDLPYIRGTPVPLEELAQLLVTPDAHLITLSDEFVGLVLPSKVYACVDSGRPVLFIGSARSDVHKICIERMLALYKRVEVGDVEACWQAIEQIADGAAGRQGSAKNPTALGR